MDIGRVAEPDCRRCPHPRRHVACVAPPASQGDHHTTAGGRLGDRDMPGGRRPLRPANVGVTDQRIGDRTGKRQSSINVDIALQQTTEPQSGLALVYSYSHEQC